MIHRQTLYQKSDTHTHISETVNVNVKTDNQQPVWAQI